MTSCAAFIISTAFRSNDPPWSIKFYCGRTMESYQSIFIDYFLRDCNCLVKNTNFFIASMLLCPHKVQLGQWNSSTQFKYSSQRWSMAFYTVKKVILFMQLIYFLPDCSCIFHVDSFLLGLQILGQVLFSRRLLIFFLILVIL